MTICTKCGGSTWEDLGYDEKKYYWVQECSYCKTKHMRSVSGVPDKYCEMYYPDFKWNTYKQDTSDLKRIADGFVNDYEEKWMGNNLSLFIYSEEFGSGKTMLASSMINSINVKFRKDALFVSGADYLALLKKEMKSDGEKELVNKYFKTDLLCIDDIGTNKKTEWSDAEYFRLLDYRYLRGKNTIITSNYDIGKLPLDPRVIDRINDMCVKLHLPEEGIRAEQASKRKMRFLKRSGYID